MWMWTCWHVRLRDSVGADIANVCNEAALIAARHGKNAVAETRLSGCCRPYHRWFGKENQNYNCRRNAFHCLTRSRPRYAISWLLEYANPLIKVTIVPRGRALGAAWYLPEERQITTKEQMLDEMCATLGGRAAEELFIARYIHRSHE